jgi:antitoxin VapB
MSLNIPAEVEQLARLVAIKTGKSPDDVLKEAVEERARAAGVSPARRRPFDEAKVRAIIERVAALPVLDTRSDDEILGYNDIGVPE